MLKLNNVKFSYPGSKFIIDIPHLEIPQGTTVSISGPSGSGKSTFLKLISGEFSKFQGSISVQNISLNSLSDSQLRELRLKHLGIVFQKPSLIDWMSVKDNILLPFSFLKETVDLEFLNKLLKELEIDQLIEKSPKELSVGEQFRVSITRALINKPDLLLADEPTANLDKDLRLKTIQLLKEECKNNNSTLLLVSHADDEIDSTDMKLAAPSWEVQ